MADNPLILTTYDVPLSRNEELYRDHLNRARARIDAALTLLDRMEEHGYPSGSVVAFAVRVELIEGPVTEHAPDDDPEEDQ